MALFNEFILDPLESFIASLPAHRPTSFYDGLTDDYSKRVLKDISDICNAYSFQDAILTDMLKAYLETNWRLIKGSSVCYTAIPTEPVTLFLCVIAKLIQEQTKSPEHDVVSLLMPGISVESIQETKFPHLYDDSTDIYTVLSTHILGRDGRYLIPIQLLVEYEEKGETRSLPNVYFDIDMHEGMDDAESFTRLSESEMTRIYAHSNLTEKLHKAKQLFQSYSNNKAYLLSRLNTLTNQLYLGSVYVEGSEESAGQNVYRAIQQFYDYYLCLNEEKKSLVPDALRRELALLHDYFIGKRKADLGSCLATRRTEIKEAIRGNEERLSTIGLPDKKRAEKINDANESYKQAFQALKSSLVKRPADYSGKDLLPIASTLLRHLKTTIVFDDYETASRILNGLSEKDILVLFGNPLSRRALMTSFDRIVHWNMFLFSLSPHLLEPLLTQLGREKIKDYLSCDPYSLLLLLDMLGMERTDILLSHIEINQTDTEGRTALILAAMHGYTEIGMRLVENGTQLNHKAWSGKVVATIGEEGDLDLVKIAEQSALEIAIENDHMTFAIWLINHDALFNDRLLHDSIVMNNGALAIALIKKTPHLNQKDLFSENWLELAITCSESAIACELIENGFNIHLKSYFKSPPLIMALHHSLRDVVWKLIDAGVDVELTDWYGKTALQLSLANNDVEITCALLQKGACFSDAELGLVMQQGQTNERNRIIQQIQNLEKKYDGGRTVLMLAVVYGHTSLAFSLIEQKVSLQTTDTAGRSALMWAAIAGCTEILERLLQEGANIHTKDITGKTALTWAIKNKHLDCARVLAKESGVDINELLMDSWKKTTASRGIFSSVSWISFFQPNEIKRISDPSLHVAQKQ